MKMSVKKRGLRVEGEKDWKRTFDHWQSLPVTVALYLFNLLVYLGLTAPEYVHFADKGRKNRGFRFFC